MGRNPLPRPDAASASHVARMQSELSDYARRLREEAAERAEEAKNVPMEFGFFERRALVLAKSSSTPTMRFEAPPPPKAPFRSITLALSTTTELGNKARRLQKAVQGLDAKCERIAGELDSIDWHRSPIVLPSDRRRAEKAAEGVDTALSEVTYERAVWMGARRAAVTLDRSIDHEPRVEWRLPLSKLEDLRMSGPGAEAAAAAVNALAMTGAAAHKGESHLVQGARHVSKESLDERLDDRTPKW